MYRCSWITNNKQCGNRTSNITCSQCEPEKSMLYHQYKEAEKTVISAINSAPRGDVIEVSKVIGRISKVIELRSAFTNRLASQSRDIGHEYHISKLLGIIEEYRAYAQKLSMNNIVASNSNEEGEDNKDQTCKLLQETNSLHVSINNSVKEDPFKDFDADIKAYIRRQKQHKSLLNQLGDIIGYKKTDLSIITYYHDLIRITCEEALNSLKKLINGYTLYAISKPAQVEYESPNLQYMLDMFKSMKKREITSWKLFHEWILKKSNTEIVIIINFSPSEKSIIAALYSGSKAPWSNKFDINTAKGLSPYMFGITYNYMNGDLVVGLRLGVLSRLLSPEERVTVDKLNSVIV